MTIPEWDQNRVIPPIRPGTPEQEEYRPENRSPYSATLAEFVRRFSTSPERALLIAGFLDYRAALHQAGITSGFQWVNGSFAEHIERRNPDPRAPNDIDVVTFFDPPGTEPGSYADLFTSELTMQDFQVDAYGMPMGGSLTSARADQIGYWHGMWSHRRGDHLNKGFVRIELNPDEDAEARRALESRD